MIQISCKCIITECKNVEMQFSSISSRNQVCLNALCWLCSPAAHFYAEKLLEFLAMLNKITFIKPKCSAAWDFIYLFIFLRLGGRNLLFISKAAELTEYSKMMEMLRITFILIALYDFHGFREQSNKLPLVKLNWFPSAYRPLLSTSARGSTQGCMRVLEGIVSYYHELLCDCQISMWFKIPSRYSK